LWIGDVAESSALLHEAMEWVRIPQALEELIACLEKLDLDSIYSEPGDFARQITRLESHLQANPVDRDAWLVLGDQRLPSGRTREAGDSFLRRFDGKPYAALAAYLDATYPFNRTQ
jgi:cytochrome c-type biogenesis protein CcmH/NrfG